MNGNIHLLYGFFFSTVCGSISILSWQSIDNFYVVRIAHAHHWVVLGCAALRRGFLCNVEWMRCDEKAAKISIFIIGWLSHFGLNCRHFDCIETVNYLPWKASWNLSRMCRSLSLSMCILKMMRLWVCVCVCCGMKSVYMLKIYIESNGRNQRHRQQPPWKMRFSPIECVHWSCLLFTYLAAILKKCF